MDNSQIVWKTSTLHNLQEYHLKQYEYPYESVKYLIKHLKNLKFSNMLEIGCGAGSLYYHLRNSGEFVYTGIDINETVINIAKEQNISNSHANFEVKCCFDLKDEQFDIVISNQCLLIISPELQDDYIKQHFISSSMYVVFFSLFTDSELEIFTRINDPYNNQIVYYNILPVKKMIEMNPDYELIVNEWFNIEKDLEIPKTPGRGTYTINTIDKGRLQFSDVIHLPWKLLIFKKRNQ